MSLRGLLSVKNNSVDRSNLVAESRQTVAALFILFSRRLYGDGKNLMAHKVRLPTKHGSQVAWAQKSEFYLTIMWRI